MEKINKPVLFSKQMLDKAFSRAKKNPFDYRTKSKLEYICKKNLDKTDVVYNIINSELNIVIENFPKINELEGFQKGFIGILLDVDKLKKSLYRLNFTRGLNKKLYMTCRYKLRHAKSINDVDSARSIYYGRISSVIDKLDSAFRYLEDSRKIINAVPPIKDRYTVVVCGFPNTGKSTLMAALSGATPAIMPYAFTTKKLLFGIIDDKVQMIDTPGVLDNLDSKNKAIQQSKLAVATLADIIVFLLDFTGDCHYSVEDQMNLKKSIEDINSNMVCCVNKIDSMKLDAKKKREIEKKVKNQVFYLSAKEKINTDELKNFLLGKSFEFYNQSERSG